MVSPYVLLAWIHQILFHPYNYHETKELLDFSAKHGIVTEAYSSLTSVLLLCMTQYLILTNFRVPKSPITHFPGGPVDEPVQAAAKRLGASPTQVLLSWVKSKGVVIVT